MSKPKLALYLDVVSPLAYLAFHVVRVSFAPITASDPHRNLVPHP